MTDLGKTDAQWSRFLGEEICGLFLAPIRDLREMRDKFAREREQVISLNDVDSNVDTNGITLSGVKFGSNTSVDGKLYVRITGGPTYTVSLYTATGASGLVAQGTGAADTNVTLSAQNSSGLTGTYDLASSVTGITDDLHHLLPVLDYRKRALNHLDATETKDSDTLDDLLSAYGQVADLMEQAKGVMVSALENYMTAVDARGPDFTGDSESALVSDVAEEDGSGAVTRKRTGAIPQLRQHMSDETTGSTQDVLKRTLTAAAGTITGDGQGAVASHTPREKCPLGTITLKCVQGGDTGDGGFEVFDGTMKITDKDEEFSFSGVQVKQSFSGPRGIGPFTITRTYTKTGDGSNNIFTAASNVSTTGESNNNTSGSAGTLWWKTEANASNWDISFYDDSSLSDSFLVAKAENIASSASFTASERNNSGLSITWQLGGTESATNGTLVCNFFVVENSNGVPDQITIAVTASSEGKIQKIVAEELDSWLNSVASTPQIDDGYVEAGTFMPFSVVDN